MYEPKLLNKAEDMFAARPIKAIYFPVNSCPANIIPKSDPYVQLTPTILPHAIKIAVVFF